MEIFLAGKSTFLLFSFRGKKNRPTLQHIEKRKKKKRGYGYWVLWEQNLELKKSTNALQIKNKT